MRARGHHQPRGQVGLVADHGIGALRPAAIGAGPDGTVRQSNGDAGHEGEFRGRRPQLQRGTDGPHGIVVMRHGSAERDVETAPLVPNGELQQGAIPTLHNGLHPPHKRVELGARPAVGVVVNAVELQE